MKQLKQFLAPSGADVLFLILLAWLFLLPPQGWERLLHDGDTGWHIRTGDWILAHGQIPRQDLFSFTKPGETWFAWEWGADVIYSLLNSSFGLRGIVVLASAQIVLFAIILCRYLIWRGANTFAALALMMFAVRAAAIHYSARPHLYTLFLIPLALWMLEADRKKPSWRVWLLVPITIAWTNLHGGVLAFLPIVCLMALGVALEDYFRGRLQNLPAQWPRYALLAALCTSATLANPYGWELHRHAVSFLNSDWIKKTISEFQSPVFGSESLAYYELLLLGGLIAAGALIARRRFVEPLWIFFWAHESLTSVRHSTILVTVAAPAVAMELTRVWEYALQTASKSSARRILDSVARDFGAGLNRSSLWPAIGLACLLLGIIPSHWPSDFPEDDFPLALVSRHGQALASSRVLTSDVWASYLIYRNGPQQRVFFDGRSDFYGPGVGNDYIGAASANGKWREILDRYRVDTVLAPDDWGLTPVLARDKAWRKVDETKKALLFQRIDIGESAQANLSPFVEAKNSQAQTNGPSPSIRTSLRAKSLQ